MSIDPHEVAGPRYDAARHLLDRQMLDADGLPAGKVDDIELVRTPEGRLLVSALLAGPGALAPRLGGRLGRWTEAVWRRARADAAAAPVRIPFAEVTEIGTSVRLARPDGGRTRGLERWILAKLVGRVPGSGLPRSTRTPSRTPAPPPPSSARTPAATDPVHGPVAVHRLGRLLGVPVLGMDGSVVGHLNDVRLGPAPGADVVRAPLRVEGFIVSSRHAGSLLGYDRRPDQGPWPVRLAVRRLHRQARHVPWRAVRYIDWERRRIEIDIRRTTPP